MGSKSFVVAVFDSALDAYSRPFFVPTTQIGVRSFSDEVNRGGSGDNPLFNHPSDYSLYCLGAWDDHSGRFENFESPELLVRAKDVKVARES